MITRKSSTLRRIVFGTVCLAIAGLAVVAGRAALDDKPPAFSGTILVGEFGSMTGKEATFGQMTHKGIMLAVEEQNARGGVKGRKIVLKDYDDQGKDTEAGTAVQRLISADKVVALLGEVASGRSIAGGRVAQQYGVPMISPSSTNPRVTKVGDMIFRVCFLDEFQGYSMAKYATETLKAKNVALLYDQTEPYSMGLKEYFKKACLKMNGKIVAEKAFSGGDQDFNAQLTSIRDAKPDAIYIPAYYTDVGNIALQTRKLGITVPLIGGDGWDSAKLGEIAGSAIDNCYYSNHCAPDEQRPEVQEFFKKFKNKYDLDSDALAALGYDAAKLLFDAMNRSPSLGGKDLAKAIASTSGFKGVTGVFSIDKERNAAKPAIIVRMKNGKPTYAATIEPTK